MRRRGSFYLQPRSRTGREAKPPRNPKPSVACFAGGEPSAMVAAAEEAATAPPRGERDCRDGSEGEGSDAVGGGLDCGILMDAAPLRPPPSPADCEASYSRTVELNIVLCLGCV